MPLKNEASPENWTWQQAVAWIAFDMQDAGDFAYWQMDFLGPRRLTVEEATHRVHQAIEELVNAIHNGKTRPIWSRYTGQFNRIDDSPNDHFEHDHIQTISTESGGAKMVHGRGGIFRLRAE
jgi:hypothetical protein